MALGSIGLSVGLSQNEQFRVKPEAVLGSETLASAFPAGSSAPAVILTNPASVDAVATAAKSVPGVVSATPGQSAGQVDVILSAEPGSAESYTEITTLREAVATVPGADAVVGGDTATRLDSKDAALRDAKVVIPIVLVIVFVVLVLLLRSFLAPVLLVATVLGTFFAALGVSWWICQHVLGYPALDNSVLLLSFLFLVALGVDYNIFLATRAREEALTSTTRDGRSSASSPRTTVFAVLGVLPLIALAQVGLIVCVGVLLDTLLVRTVLVPALAFVFGERFWWPAKVDGRGHHDADGGVVLDDDPTPITA